MVFISKVSPVVVFQTMAVMTLSFPFRSSTLIDACRLRRAERYKACVDDMPFDCPLRPRAEGVEIGFYLIITDVPLCCAVCPVPT